MYLTSMTAALPEAPGPMRVTAHKEMDEMFTSIQMYHCSMKAKLSSTCPAMFNAMTVASRRTLGLLTESILPWASCALSTNSRIR